MWYSETSVCGWLCIIIFFCLYFIVLCSHYCNKRQTKIVHTVTKVKTAWAAQLYENVLTANSVGFVMSVRNVLCAQTAKNAATVHIVRIATTVRIYMVHSML